MSRSPPRRRDAVGHRTEDSPTRSTVTPEAGGPVPHPREGGEKAQRALVPRPREAANSRQRRCTARGRSRVPPSPPALPSRARSRSRRTAAEEMRPAGARARPGRGPARGSPRTGRPTDRAELNPPGRLRGHHPFTSQRFHALLNSLFKVLFNFPLRYLSTIGLVPVFSLRWSLPPALGCIHKQPDSEKTVTPARRGPLPASHHPRDGPRSEGFRPPNDTGQ